jgi:hypothetical protein
MKRLTRHQALKIQSKFLEAIMTEYPQISNARVTVVDKEGFQVQMYVNLQIEIKDEK